MDYTFNLKRNIILPSPTVRNALLVFPSWLCALSYKVIPYPREKRLEVFLIVVDKVDNSVLFDLAHFVITEAGFGTGVFANQADLDTWDTAAAPLLALSKNLNELLMSKDFEIQQIVHSGGSPSQALLDEVSTIVSDLAHIAADLEHLGPRPESQEVVINRYSDVIGYFDNTMSITADGILWAKQIPFLGATIGDFIK